MQIDLVAWHSLWMVSIWCTDLDSSRIKGERNSLIGVHRRARMVIQYSCIWHFLSPWSAPGLPRDISRAADLGQDFSSLWSVMTGPGEATRAPGHQAPGHWSAAVCNNPRPSSHHHGPSMGEAGLGRPSDLRGKVVWFSPGAGSTHSHWRDPAQADAGKM